MNALTTYRWSFEEDVYKYCDAGYRAIGVWRRKLADFGEEKGVELLRDSGLDVSNLLWAGGFTGSDGRGHRESIDDAREAIRLASAMHAGCLIVCTGGRNNHISRQAERLLSTALDALVPLAELHDVTLALEPMHTTYSEEWTLLNDLDRAARVVDDYDSPYLKLAIDMYHVEYDAQSPAMSPNFVNRVAIVQLADRRTAPSADQDRCPLGEGVVPLGEIVSSLIAGGYRGDFDIELIGCDVERDNYVSLIEQSRAFASKLLADAQTPCEVRSSALL